MKTAIVYHFFAHYRKGVLAELAALGCEFELWGEDRRRWNGIDAIPAGQFAFRNAPFYQFAGILFQPRALLLPFRRDVARVVYLGDAHFLSTWISSFFARAFGKEVVFWTHGAVRRDFGGKRILRRAFYNIAHKVMVYGEIGASLLEEYGIRREKIFVIGNSVETAITKKSSRKRDARRILCVGRLTREKRLSEILLAAAHLEARGQRFRVRIVGAGPEHDALVALAKEKGVELEMQGACHDVELLAEVYRESDVSVIPGAAGLTVLQSLAHGVPVVVNDDWRDQMPEAELVVPNVNGMLFESGSVESLADAILRASSLNAYGEEAQRILEWSTPRSHARRIYAAFEGRKALQSSPLPAFHSRYRLLIVSNGVTPYGISFIERLRKEISGAVLGVAYSFEYSTGKWPHSEATKRETHILGRGVWAKPPTTPLQIFHDLGIALRLCALLRRWQPNAIILFGYSTIAHIALLLTASRSRVQVLIWADSNARSERGSSLKLSVKKWVLPWILSRARGFLVCGEAGRSYFEKYGCCRNSMFTCPNEPDYGSIVAPTHEAMSTLRSQLDLPKGRRRFLFVGRLVEEKSPVTLVEAFLEICSLRPEWDLLVIGDGPLRESLEHLSLLGSGRIVLAGNISSNEVVRAVYGQCDVLVLPSVYEPWGVVVTEAAAAGCALVCTSIVGSASELIIDRVNGRILDNCKVDVLKEALLDVSRSGVTDAMKHASKERFRRWHSDNDPVKGVKAALAHICKFNETTSKSTSIGA